MEQQKSLEELILELPPDLRGEVRDFVEFLLSKREKKQPRERLSLSWVGAAEDLKDKYTSVELQHQILKWWVGEQ